MTAVFLCTCQRPRDAAAWAASITRLLARSVPEAKVFAHPALCGAEGMRFAAARAGQEKPDSVLLAGCRALQSPAYAARFAAKAGTRPGKAGAAGAPGAASAKTVVSAVRIFPAATAADAARALRNAVRRSQLLPTFARRRLTLRGEVLVVGGGRAAWTTARLTAGLGHPTVLAAGENEPVPDGMPGVEVLPGVTLVSLTGRMGCFSAHLRRHRPGCAEAGEIMLETGAAVIAHPHRHAEIPAQGPVVPLSRLERLMEGTPYRGRQIRVGILLDFRVDEGTESFENAARIGLRLMDRFPARVDIVLRDARVAGYGLEELFDRARERGISFLKHDGAPEISAGDPGSAASVRYHDAVAGEDVEVAFDVLAISEPGCAPLREDELAAAAGLGQDAWGGLGPNNPRFLPLGANRPGVFLVETGTERETAFSVHALLSQPAPRVELSHAVVDGEACALCLTCVRSCPFSAMRIEARGKKAECVPESCRKCGICAAECPARAIMLPAWSEEVLMAMAGASP